MTYDAAGDTTGDGTTTYTFDAEHRMTSSSNSSSGLYCYTYDASGWRVRKDHVTQGTCSSITADSFSDYTFDLSGRVVGEFLTGNALNRSEVFAGGRHLATFANNTNYFNHADWLGTIRARSSSSGASYETCTSLPFGDGFSCSGGADPDPNHFTDLIHDSESDLENTQFRQHSPSFGRWMSPDPAGLAAADSMNPQSWNGYAYVTNSPLAYIDPLGLGQCPGQPGCAPRYNGPPCRNPMARLNGGCAPMPPGSCDWGGPLCGVGNPNDPNALNCEVDS